MRPRDPDNEDIRRAYRDNVAAVYAFFAYSVAKPWAEDLTAATFERVIRKWRSFDPERAPVRTWVLAIARNLLIDHLRRERHRVALSTDEHPELVDRIAAQQDPVAQLIAVDELKLWLGSLKEREREILALRYGADLPTAEIAEMLGLSTANVDQIISRSLRRLRQSAQADSLIRSA